MASIGITSPYPNTTTGTSSSNASSSGSSASSTTAADPLANESTFLTLLVSQLKNQDPASPMDGTTFVTQLAQFSDLEQNLAMRTDLDALTNKYAGTSTATSSTSSGTAQSSNTTATSQSTPSSETTQAAALLNSALPAL